MKIVAFVEGAFPERGGLGLVGVPTILASLAACGHRTILFIAGPPTPGRERFVAAGPEQALAKAEGKGSFGMVSFPARGSWRFSMSMIGSARRQVREADFVSLHSFYAFPVLLGYLLSRLYRKPFGVWPHGVLGTVQRRSGVKKKRIYDFLVGQRILKHASVLFYSAKGERNEAAVLELKAPSVIIPDGIDTSEFSSLPTRGNFRQRYMSGHQGPLVLFVARLTSKKGVDLLVAAMKIVCQARPDVRLAIVGAPDPVSFREKVDGWISEHGMTANTVVTGQISPTEKLEALADADVFCLPSEAENFGFSMFEAMASRVPVVVSDTP